MNRVWGSVDVFVCDYGWIVVNRRELQEAGIKVRFKRGGWPRFLPRKNTAILDDFLAYFLQDEWRLPVPKTGF